MRVRRVVVGSAVVVLVGVGVVVPAYAGLTTFCDGTAADVTIPGDLVVARDDSCELTDVVISGDTIVRADGNLLLAGGRVDGDLTVQADGFASTAAGTVVTGVTRVQSSFGVFAENSDLAGVVNVRDAGFFYSFGTTHGADVVSLRGETFVESGWVTGSMRTSGDRFTDITDTVVNGRLQVVDPSDGSAVCASEVDGHARITGSGGQVRVGAGTAGADCGPAVFAAGLKMSGNGAGVVVSDAVVRGNLACADNSPAPVGDDNRVRGKATGQCKNLPSTTAGVGSGLMSSSSTTGVDRRAAVLDMVADRTRAGQTAAFEAGRAFD